MARLRIAQNDINYFPQSVRKTCRLLICLSGATNMTGITRVLFSFSAHQFVIESGELPFEVARRGHDVTVAILWDGAPARVYAARLREAGLHVLHYSGENAVGPSAPATASALANATTQANVASLRGALQSVLRLVLKEESPIRRLFALPGFLRRSVRARRAAIDIYNAAGKPSVFFTSSFGSILDIENHLAKLFRDNGGRLYCYPTYPCYGEDIYIRRRFQAVDIGMWNDNLRVDTDWINKLLAKIFPDWTRTLRGKSQFAKNPIEMLAAWLAGMLYYDAWGKPYAIYDRIYVPYDFSVDVLVRNGYTADVVKSLGKPSIDRVAATSVDDALARRMASDLGVTLDEAYILFNVAPSFEHQNTSLEQHRAQFLAICEVLKATGQKVVMSLHPICDYSTYHALVADYGFAISRDYSIYQLQPFCRFVVSHHCTTNYQAALVGKKVIDIDYLGLRFEEDISLIAPEEMHPNILIVAPEDLGKVVESLIKETAHENFAVSEYYRNHQPAVPRIVSDAIEAAIKITGEVS